MHKNLIDVRLLYLFLIIFTSIPLDNFCPECIDCLCPRRQLCLLCLWSWLLLGFCLPPPCFNSPWIMAHGCLDRLALQILSNLDIVFFFKLWDFKFDNIELSLFEATSLTNPRVRRASWSKSRLELITPCSSPLPRISAWVHFLRLVLNSFSHLAFSNATPGKVTDSSGSKSPNLKIYFLSSVLISLVFVLSFTWKQNVHKHRREVGCWGLGQVQI